MKQLIQLTLLLFCSTCIWVNAQAQQLTHNENALSVKEKSIIIISSFVAKGDMGELKKGLQQGLEAGLTVSEIKEMLVQLYAYCGFPRSLNAINTFKDLIDERKTKGITDSLGVEMLAYSGIENKYEQGRKTLEELTGVAQPKPAKGYGEFARRIDIFLKEHLFADVFSSPVLNYKQREWVTLAALATMEGVETQLYAHISVGKNTGITNNQLAEMAGIIDKNISRLQANIIRKAIGQPVQHATNPSMMVRIAEVEIFPQYLEPYTAILKQEAAASLLKEPGVIAIFPMSTPQNPLLIKIVEVYRDSAAYVAHIQSPHFLHYKTGTAKMVKSLQLVDMNPLDAATMTVVFSKL